MLKSTISLASLAQPSLLYLPYKRHNFQEVSDNRVFHFLYSFYEAFLNSRRVQKELN